jgi:hypothetical protein
MTDRDPFFDATMRSAQEAYGAGRFLTAEAGYADAFHLARAEEPPNYLGATRAARGALESRHRQGFTDGERTVLWHDRTADSLSLASRYASLDLRVEVDDLYSDGSPAGAYDLVRESIQTRTVLAKLVLRKAIGLELYGAQADEGELSDMLEGVRAAMKHLRIVERGGPIDQYRINLFCPVLPFAERLHGSWRKGVWAAVKALRYARQSESPKLLTAAGLGEEHRRQAVTKATKRAGAALLACFAPRSVALQLGARAV